MKLWLQYLMLGVLCTALGYFAVELPTAYASDGPAYGMLPFDSAYATQSTADQTLLSAPGTDRAWRVTGFWYHVATAEANANVLLEDAAGTATVLCSIPLDTKGSECYISFEEGILCHTNSAVQVDFSGSTGEAAFIVNGYQERTN